MPYIPAFAVECARDPLANDVFLGFPGVPGTANAPSGRMHLVPLSRRPSSQLRAQAAELMAMAATATTAEVKAGLEVLAARFATLAARRAAEEETGSLD